MKLKCKLSCERGLHFGTLSRFSGHVPYWGPYIRYIRYIRYTKYPFVDKCVHKYIKKYIRYIRYIKKNRTSKTLMY